jgi:hypothetical protein
MDSQELLRAYWQPRQEEPAALAALPADPVALRGDQQVAQAVRQQLRVVLFERDSHRQNRRSRRSEPSNQETLPKQQRAIA